MDSQETSKSIGGLFANLGLDLPSDDALDEFNSLPEDIDVNKFIEEPHSPYTFIPAAPQPLKPVILDSHHSASTLDVEDLISRDDEEETDTCESDVSTDKIQAWDVAGLLTTLVGKIEWLWKWM
ncbi:hypothetical protein ONZ45_g690 [Pleurotus djamor]|nr:hypothetical protein ONZ45_g690 [Pleurotus djamor]